MVGGDTLLMAKFPACLSKNKGQKQRRGDMRTPECTQAKPFYIDAIKDASAWYHDFKDGRGSIKAYGAWFLRLVTPGHKGIGIHGSTNNESSVPGRASEGCIRLRDPDIILRTAHALPDDVRQMFAQEFETNDIWKHFRAVQEGRVYDLTYSNFGMSATFSYPDALNELRTYLYESA